ncbi:cytochrome P450 [Frankia sp. EI5c]|uniref:cytochrome P450 n=1 Tax=Frankia sp. EI5c TaxID=683316 RepID=UPI0007C3406A|nr:cytochrome P450 [Frankia sp. EI5c]OAA27386.1 cytochrome P450 [Frankia sp. EI5c]
MTGTTTLTDHHIAGSSAVEVVCDRFDALRAAHPVVRVTEPEAEYWMVLDYELMRQCLQNPAVFSSSVISPLNADSPYKMIPIQLDPPEHAGWRRLMASYFAPKQIERLRPELIRRAGELAAEIRAKGECDYVEEFALKFPTVVFLEMMGLPVDELPRFLEWEAMMLGPADESGGHDNERMIAGMLAAVAYFQTEITRRRESGERREGELLSAMVDWELDGQAVSDDDLLNCCLLLFLAGLDTVAMSLSYAMYHLATHHDDRARVAALAAAGEPMDDVVEEMLRFYAVPEIGRRVTQDIEVGGQLMKAGDLVLFPLVAGNRDDALVPDAGRVDLARGRRSVPHLAFGGGPHRCLGSHLARLEMEIALAAWHAVIPQYSLGAHDGPLAYWGTVHGMFALPLTGFGPQ